MPKEIISLSDRNCQGLENNQSPKPTKQDIIEKSAELYLKSFFSSVTFRDVAEYCGISIYSVRHYFQNKSELIEAVLSWVIEAETPFFEQYNSIVRSPNTRGKKIIHSFFRDFYVYYLGNPAIALPYYAVVGFSEKTEKIDQLSRKHAKLWESTLSKVFGTYYKEKRAWNETCGALCGIVGSFRDRIFDGKHNYTDKYFEILLNRWSNRNSNENKKIVLIQDEEIENTLEEQLRILGYFPFYINFLHFQEKIKFHKITALHDISLVIIDADLDIPNIKENDELINNHLYICELVCQHLHDIEIYTNPIAIATTKKMFDQIDLKKMKAQCLLEKPLDVLNILNLLEPNRMKKIKKLTN